MSTPIYAKHTPGLEGQNLCAFLQKMDANEKLREETTTECLRAVEARMHEVSTVVAENANSTEIITQVGVLLGGYTVSRGFSQIVTSVLGLDGITDAIVEMGIDAAVVLGISAFIKEISWRSKPCSSSDPSSKYANIASMLQKKIDLIAGELNKGNIDENDKAQLETVKKYWEQECSINQRIVQAMPSDSSQKEESKKELSHDQLLKIAAEAVAVALR